MSSEILTINDVSKELEDIERELKDIERQKRLLLEKKDTAEKLKVETDYAEEFNDTYWIWRGNYIHIKSVNEIIRNQEYVKCDNDRIRSYDDWREFMVFESTTLHRDFFKDLKKDMEEKPMKISREQFNEYIDSVKLQVDGFRKIYETLKKENHDGC